MRIACLSDAVLPTPTPGAHGLGRVTSIVAETLLARGHDITLYAREGSRFSGQLVTPEGADGYPGEWLLAQAAVREHKRHAFDAFLDNGHLHCIAEMFPHYPVADVFHDMFQEYARCPVVPSGGIRAMMGAEFENARIIPNALPAAEFPFNDTPAPQGYALFIGALSDIKQPMLAVEACARAGIPLILAGSPLTGQLPITLNSNTHYVGAVRGQQKLDLLQGARVLLQLGWAESFGLTTLEANLCGTPAVAWPSGGSLDLIRYGANGVFVIPGGDIVQSVVDAIERAWYMDRWTVRQTVEGRFSVDAQVNAVEDVLADVIQGRWW